MQQLFQPNREKYNVDPKAFDLPLKRMTLNQQRDAYQHEIQQLKEENIQLGLEVKIVIPIFTSLMIIYLISIEPEYQTSSATREWLRETWRSVRSRFSPAEW